MDDYPYNLLPKRLGHLLEGWTKLHALCEAQNWKCAYCSCEIEITHPRPGESSPHYMATADHIIPKSHGGNWRWSNLVAACRRCNMERGTIPAVEWYIKVSAK